MKLLFSILLCLLAPLAATAQYWEGRVVYLAEMQINSEGLASAMGGKGIFSADSIERKLKKDPMKPDSLVLYFGQSDFKVVMYRKNTASIWYHAKTAKLYSIKEGKDVCAVSDALKAKDIDTRLADNKAMPLASNDTVLGRVCKMMVLSSGGLSLKMSYSPGYPSINPGMAVPMCDGTGDARLLGMAMYYCKALPLKLDVEMPGMMTMKLTAIQAEAGSQADELKLPRLEKYKAGEEPFIMEGTPMRIVR